MLKKTKLILLNICTDCGTGCADCTTDANDPVTCTKCYTSYYLNSGSCTCKSSDAHLKMKKMNALCRLTTQVSSVLSNCMV